MTERKSYIIAPLPGYQPEIGRWLWGLEDVRRTIKTRLQGVSQEIIDTKVDGIDSIGTLLYHMALIEADWFYVEVLETEFPPEIRKLFPFDCRNADGSLVHVDGESLEQHWHRMDTIRDILLAHFQQMDITDWRKPRVLPQYDVTPEWVIYHLIEHEAHHRGHIFQLLHQLGQK